MKPVFWVGRSRADTRAFPAAARRSAGFQLHRVQEGLDPVDWRPMNELGRGVREIRIHTGEAYRIFYVTRFAEGVYVLHAFEKRSRKTTKRDLDTGRQRYRDLLEIRRAEGRDAKAKD